MDTETAFTLHRTTLRCIKNLNSSDCSAARRGFLTQVLQRSHRKFCVNIDNNENRRTVNLQEIFAKPY